MIARMLQDLTTYGTAIGLRRFVSPRRARKLRKRGEYVQYVSRTARGKAIYQWTLRVAPDKFFNKVKP